MIHATNARVKRAYLTAVVTRADGTVEELGVIADTARGTLRVHLDGIAQRVLGRFKKDA